MLTQQQEHALAKQYGYKCTLDPQRGGNWAKFNKANYFIWQVLQNGKQAWQTAYRVNGIFLGHGIKATLEEAMAVYDSVKPLVVNVHGGSGIHASYVLSYNGWDFTAQYHHVKKGWYCEAIWNGQERWHNTDFYSTETKAILEILHYCDNQFGGTHVPISEKDFSRITIQNFFDLKPEGVVIKEIKCDCGGEKAKVTCYPWCALKQK